MCTYAFNTYTHISVGIRFITLNVYYRCHYILRVYFLQLHILYCPSGPSTILKGVVAAAFTGRRGLPLIRTKNDIPFCVLISAHLYYEKHRGL